MNAINANNRLAWIDWSKTILIFLMVVGHSGISGLSEQFIISFHMPAFFIISGYLFKPGDWKQTVRSFGIPILFYSSVAFVLYGAVECLKNGLGGVMNWMPQALGTLVFRGYQQANLFLGVWFVEVLLLLRLFFGDIPFMRIFFRHYKATAIAFFVLSMILTSLEVPEIITNVYIYRFVTCLPFFAFGMLLKEYGLMDRVAGAKWYFVLILLVLFVVSVLTNTPLRIYSNLYGNSYLQSFVSAILGSLLLYICCTRLAGNKLVENISTGTLLILGTHSMLFIPIFYFFKIIHISSYWGYFLSGLFVLTICYLPIVFFSKRFPILLGKKNKK